MDLQHNHIGAKNIIATIARVWKLQARIWYEHMNTQHMNNNWELGFARNTQQINFAKLQAIRPRKNSQCTQKHLQNHKRYCELKTLHRWKNVTLIQN
jgi:hypothetical protein